MKTANIYFANGSMLVQSYDTINIDGEWLHFMDSVVGRAYLSVSSRAVLYIEHDVDA